MKEDKITVKQAVEHLRLEELKYVALNEIEDESEENYTSSSNAKSSAKSAGQGIAADDLTVIGSIKAAGINATSISTTQTNNTLGSFSMLQYNATCAGFRFGYNGGLFLSCAP